MDCRSLRAVVLCLSTVLVASSPYACRASGAPHSAATVTEPVFPPASAFVLPSSAAGGAVTVVGLPTSDLGWPAPPKSRNEYDIAGRTAVYRISIFSSVTDANESFDWQMSNGAAGRQFLTASQKYSSRERLYVVGGYLVYAVLLRNVEFVPSAPTQNGSADATQAVETLMQYLVRALSSYMSRSSSTSTTTPSSTAAPTNGTASRTDARLVALRAMLEPLFPLFWTCSDDLDAFSSSLRGLRSRPNTTQDVRNTAQAVSVDCETLARGLQRYGSTLPAIQAALPEPLRSSSTVADLIWQLRRFVTACVAIAGQIDPLLDGTQSDTRPLETEVAIAADARARVIADVQQLKKAWHY